MEEEVVTQDAAPASSTGTDPNGQPTPPAATQPGTPGQPTEQTVPYGRFREVIGQNQQLRQATAQLQGRIQQMEALQQKAQQQGGLSPTDQGQYREAADAIKQIFKSDPELASLLNGSQHQKQMEETQKTLTEMRSAQMRTIEQRGVQQIEEFLNREGVPKEEAARKVFIKLVESMALTIPQAKERFAQGDLTLLDEAAELTKPLLAHLKREAQTQLLDTKNRTRSLPPASRGGAAGPPGLPKLDPNDPRAYQSALAKAATAMLNDKG